MFDTQQLPYTCSAAALMSLQPILVTMSKNEAGRFDYSVPMSTMLSEVPWPPACLSRQFGSVSAGDERGTRLLPPCSQGLKLVLSALMLAQQMASHPVQLLADAPLAEFASMWTRPPSSCSPR
eukprot:scaffold5846_cov118-Isochrysis_galbana.AAC.1